MAFYRKLSLDVGHPQAGGMLRWTEMRRGQSEMNDNNNIINSQNNDYYYYYD